MSSESHGQHSSEARNAGLTRRRFLLGGAAAGFGVGGLSALRAESTPAKQPAKLPKSIIFCVSDGMSGGVPGLAEMFSRQTRDVGTHWHSLLRSTGAVHGLVDTASASSPVTDSAAAASAWGGARLVNNGCINILPDGASVTPIAQLLKGQGKSVGLVTTATVTHATPAGFAANVPARSEEFEIAPQYLDRVDVILGGGSVFFDPASRPDGADYFKKFRGAGYTVVESGEALGRAGSPAKLLGVFSKSHLPYVIDRAGSAVPPSIPPLAECTKVALRLLAQNPDGFFLMIEGARVDHAAHQNDIAALLREQLDFDDALGVALEFAAKNPDTLVVATSDHGNSNPGLNGTGAGYSGSGPAFSKVAEAKESFGSFHEWISKAVEKGEEPTPGKIANRARESLGFEPAPEEIAQLIAYVKKNPLPDWSKQHSNFWGLLGRVAGNHFSTGWTGISHTNDYTLLTATGPGAEHLAGLQTIDQVGAALRKLFGLRG